MYTNTITPKEAKKILSQRDDIIVLDVRNENEYREGHIKGSKLMPIELLETNIEDEVPDKNSTIFIYCNSGKKAKIAYEHLKELGYNNLYDLGGIEDWPYEIEK
ncbi:rhodanese-like domain-containing protein [Clostridium tepidum]|jgi:rhodanese-related sulfurtransferase|uniref:Sulfurtransferase n=1 Tax=Clostridium tepidum TaxID=1962263 RepID=A0A1S9I0S8_9CLOT|nr:rhodanese-like domain-containing protein [Clostridium tepidum]MCR1933453.1 rhodanese-like domain-containing protein [Clostridium tepidum]MDU6878150.1 rhodanese-like domain-containing protein [Clostridium botulinum]OOO61721.1 sulfurtransferase [Clostridium tepidum]OOO63907.1 sulfurtransferase [Clostridium tepidum]